MTSCHSDNFAALCTIDLGELSFNMSFEDGSLLEVVTQQWKILASAMGMLELCISALCCVGSTLPNFHIGDSS